jgi:fatty acid desaturase
MSHKVSETAMEVVLEAYRCRRKDNILALFAVLLCLVTVFALATLSAPMVSRNIMWFVAGAASWQAFLTELDLIKLRGLLRFLEQKQ